MFDEKDLQVLQELKRDILEHASADRQELKRDILKQTSADMQELKRDILKQTSTDMQELKRDILEESAANTRVILENSVERELRLLAEGQKTLLEKIDRLAPMSRVEALEDEVAFLKQIMKNLAGEVSELKKAQ